MRRHFSVFIFFCPPLFRLTTTGRATKCGQKNKGTERYSNRCAARTSRAPSLALRVGVSEDDRSTAAAMGSGTDGGGGNGPGWLMDFGLLNRDGIECVGLEQGSLDLRGALVAVFLGGLKSRTIGAETDHVISDCLHDYQPNCEKK